MDNLTKADWMMIETKRDVLSEAMGFSKVVFADTVITFFDKFKKSGFLPRFETGDGRVTLGCSGAELALMINSYLGDKRGAAEFRDKINIFDITAPAEHWIGHALGYLQGRSGWTFDEIFDKLPLDSWYGRYILHEAGDRVLWDKTLGQYINS